MESVCRTAAAGAISDRTERGEGGAPCRRAPSRMAQVPLQTGKEQPKEPSVEWGAETGVDLVVSSG